VTTIARTAQVPDVHDPAPTAFVLDIDRPASIRSSAIRPSTSVSENSSYAATGSSPEPSVARIRGRSTGTRRPPRLTDPGPWPCRVAARCGSWRPLGPHTAVTFAPIIAAITCSPVPTASASRPSRSSPASSPSATLTCSGTAGWLVSISWFW